MISLLLSTPFVYCFSRGFSVEEDNFINTFNRI